MTVPSMIAILGVWAAVAVIAWKHEQHVGRLCLAAVLATLVIAVSDSSVNGDPLRPATAQPARAADTGPSFHTDPSCWLGPRIYDTGEARAGARAEIKISQMNRTTLDEQNMRWVPSPNSAYRFSTIAGSAAKPSNIALLIEVERPYVLRVERDDTHAITDEHWINEGLLFFRLWGSPIRGIDVVLDVESEKIRLADTFEYGEIAYQQFQAGCKRPEANCRCKPQ